MTDPSRPSGPAGASAPPAAGRFAGKVAFVTGASDGGIGAAIARRFCEEGGVVALASRERPDRLLKSLARLGAGCDWWSMDITAAEAVPAVLDQCLARFGRIDILVNNAGIGAARPLAEMADEEWRPLIDVNLQGTICVTQAAIPRLTGSGGVIVNVSSALGLAGNANCAVYSASKAGLNGFTQSLAWELAPRGVRVVGVAPALVRTPLLIRRLQHLTAASAAQINASHPLGLGMPQDVAAAVAFLASEEARWITGVTLPLGWAPQFALPTV
jgi:NAD(P)-dependent dehydrogenase (short-subunit alcohol dehydrogenase family)